MLKRINPSQMSDADRAVVSKMDRIKYDDEVCSKGRTQSTVKRTTVYRDSNKTVRSATTIIHDRWSHAIRGSSQ